MEQKSPATNIIFAPEPQARSDVTILTSDQKVLKLHSALLAIRSTVLDAAGSANERHEIRMEIVGEQATTFFKALYEVNIHKKISKDEAITICPLAHKYKCNEVGDACVEIFKDYIKSCDGLFGEEISSLLEICVIAQLMNETALSQLICTKFKKHLDLRFNASTLFESSRLRDLEPSVWVPMLQHLQQQVQMRSKKNIKVGFDEPRQVPVEGKLEDNVIFSPEPQARSDVTILTSDQKVLKLHSTLLAIRSTVLDAACSAKEHHEIRMELVGEHAKTFFKALYEVNILRNVSKDDAIIICPLADRYECNEVRDACVEIFKEYIKACDDACATKDISDEVSSLMEICIIAQLMKDSVLLKLVGSVLQKLLTMQEGKILIESSKLRELESSVWIPMLQYVHEHVRKNVTIYESHTYRGRYRSR